MKKKRLAIGLLALSACFGLASCKDEEKKPPIVETEGYTITFNANGHGTAPSSISDAKTIPTLTELTESGWTFGGWYKDSACTEKAEAGTALTEDITLYAKWTENVAPEVKYSITYEINGHGVQPSAESEVTALPATLPELTAEGWTFDGWYTDELCTIAAVAGATITENTTLYAKWTENVVPEEKYSVTYVINGHGVQPDTLNNVTALPATLPELTAEGWTFDGWYTDELCTIAAVEGATITENTTLYAKWTENVVPEEKYSVTYVINGHGTQPSAESEVTALPATLPELTAEGWTFDGWYTDELCTIAAVEGATITENTTLYAKWTENVVPEEKYSVTYVINGHGTQPSAESEVTALPTDLPVLTESGWTFDGWYTDELCTIAAVEGATITENTTLYAKWTEKSSYEKFLEQGNIYYQNDFSNAEETVANSMDLADVLALGQIFGYSSSNIAFTETNTVKIEDGKLMVLDSSADTTYGYIWLDLISYRKISVYAELTPSANNGSWSLFNLVDDNDSEIASVRTISSGKLGFRANGVSSTEYIDLNANDTVKVLITLDLLNSKVSFTYNGTLLGEADINSSVTILAALKLVTAGSASRDIAIDNVAVRVEEYTAEELKTKLTEKLDSLYEGLNVEVNYTTNKEEVETAYSQGTAALSAAETAEEILTAYLDAVDAISAVASDQAIALEEARGAAFTQIDEIKTENEMNYTIAGVNENLFRDAISQAEQTVNNATTVEAIQNAISTLNENLANIPTDAELIAEAKNEATADLQSYVNADDYTLNAESLAAVISQALSDIEAAESSEQIQEIVSTAKLAIDEIPTDAELIAEAKSEAVIELTNYRTDEIAEISEESFGAILTQISEAKENGTANINSALSIESVTAELTAAKGNIDTLIASTQKTLDEVKTDAISDLTAYANEKIAGYDETADADLITSINGLVSSHSDTINAQEDNADVMQALTAAKAEIDELIAADSLAKAKTAAVEELTVFKDELVSQYYLEAAQNLFITEYTGQVETLNAITDIMEVQQALENAKTELTDLIPEAEALELEAREDYETNILGDVTTTADFAAYATELGTGKTVAAGTEFGPVTVTTAGTTKTKLSSSECGLSVKSAVFTLTTTTANAKMTILYYSTSSGRTFTLTGPDGNPYGAGTSGTAGVYEASTWGKNVIYTIVLGEAGEYNLTFDANEHKLTSITLTEEKEQTVTVKVNSLTATLAEEITSQTAIADIISSVELELDNEGVVSNEMITEGYTVSVKLNGQEAADLTSPGEYEVTVVYGTSANKYNSCTMTFIITE